MNTKQMAVISAMIAVSASLSAAPAHAQTSGQAASPAAQQQLGQASFFERVGDWFATVGKSSGEKQVILAERRAKREADDLADQAKKAAAGELPDRVESRPGPAAPGAGASGAQTGGQL